MSFIIQDGTGTGNKVKVDNGKRLYTEAITRTHNRNASVKGEAFNINTGIINLTSASKSAVFYLKNTGSRDIILNNIIINYGTSTGGALGDSTVNFVKNPTAGTIVSSASSVTVVNRNLGSSNVLDASVFKGAEARTITDGSELFTGLAPQVQLTITLDAEEITIPKSSSIGINITPATGNTSVNVIIAMTCYLRDEG